MRKNTIIRGLATAGAAALIVGGCSNGSDGSSDEPAATSSQPSAQFNEADVEYAEGMVMHHEQAIEMSDIILGKSGVEPDVVELAQQIKKAQGPEIEQMQSWLKDWDQGDSDHGEHDESMSDTEDMHEGMMSPKDLEELKEADAERTSTLFLDQMIEHHQGAVTMAQQHRQDGDNSEAVELSANVIRDQNAEIKEMRELRTSL